MRGVWWPRWPLGGLGLAKAWAVTPAEAWVASPWTASLRAPWCVKLHGAWRRGGMGARACEMTMHLMVAPTGSTAATSEM
eukprot:2185383-Prymnesium_polylepis.1